MPAAATPRIHEDEKVTPVKAMKASKGHKRIPSVGDVLRGRKHDKMIAPNNQSETSTAPLGELHLNSPPQSQRVLVKGDGTRPRMHKKADSSVSISSIFGSKDKQSDTRSIHTSEGQKENQKPKKSKSSTNLTTLLKKRSKRNLKDDGASQDIVVSPKSLEAPYTPIWAQFATQPQEDCRGRLQYPPGKSRTMEDEIALYTPQECTKGSKAQQRNFHDSSVPTSSPQPPQRPYLEHRSSRSSIFTEDLEENQPPPIVRPKSRDEAANRPRPSSHASSRPALESKNSDSSQISNGNKRGSRVLAAIDTLNRSSQIQLPSPLKGAESHHQPLTPPEVDSAFEKVLDALNVPQNMRDTMRSLKPEVKAGLIKGERIGSGSSVSSLASDLSIRSTARSPKKENVPIEDNKDEGKESKRSRSRPRSRVFTLTKRDRDDPSPSKKQKGEKSTRSRGKSRPESIDLSNSRPGSSRSMQSSCSMTSLASPESASPSDFIHYLREVQKPELIEVGKMHKLRILLRNETVTWTDAFIKRGGMDELVQLLYRIVKVEWREEHEDALLHETLLCVKALCTTSLALQRVTDIRDQFFPKLLSMLFDEEKKGPSEFNTRATIISLLFAHLSESQHGTTEPPADRALVILKYLQDPAPEDEKKPLGFIQEMHVSRPYRVWCKEVVNVTKEVFWIFLHHLNVIPVTSPETAHDDPQSYAKLHFPKPRPPHPAAPYVGGVEWEATQYLAIHLDLLNGLVASLPTQQGRNDFRRELRDSGWEKCMGGTMRTCKEKFYGGVHEGLRVWVAAAKADGWQVEDVRSGPPRDAPSPRKSPAKKGLPPPKLDVKLDLGVDVGGAGAGDAWL